MDTWPLKYEYFHKLNADMQVRATPCQRPAHSRTHASVGSHPVAKLARGSRRARRV